MKAIDHQHLAKLRNHTGYRRLRLKDWETFKAFEVHENCVNLIIETFDVQETVREDRFNKHGFRMMTLKPTATGKWDVVFDATSWDEEFEPFVHVRWGRGQTPEEYEAQREFEKMCYRPGNKMTPLDSYERVLDPFVRSTDRMERHF